jgi:hypothetical protein
MNGFRLSSDVQAELTWIWCYADADLGMCIGADLSHRGPPDKEQLQKQGMREVEHERGQRFRSSKAKLAKRDEELRLMWQTIVCKGDRHVSAKDDPVDCTMASGGEPFVMDRTPMPQWAMRIVSKDRQKATRVHRTLQRLIGYDSGIVHARVLYRAYGPVLRHPVCYGRVGAELSPIVEHTNVVAALIRAGQTPQDAGESLLRKGSEMVVHRVKARAEAMLVAASKSYTKAHQEERRQRMQDREAKFRALLRAS